METETGVSCLQVEGHLEPPALGRGMEVFSTAGEVVTAGLYLDFGFQVQSRAFALGTTPSACNTLSSLAEPQLLPGLPVHVTTVPSNFTFSLRGIISNR